MKCFIELLRQVKDKALNAYDYQDIPFEKLVDHLDIERSLAHEPLFQVMFILQSIKEGEGLNLKINIEGVDFECPISKFDLTLSLQESEGWFRRAIEYATDLLKIQALIE